MANSRVLVVVNKWWECEPVMNVLLNNNARPWQVLGWPDPLHHPRPRPNPANLPPEQPAPVPRATFHLNNISAEVWCISDLLEHYPDEAKYQSSSEVKMRHLSKIVEGEEPALVIAVGTAGYPSEFSENGSVVIGSKVFMHDCHPDNGNPDSKWHGGPFDTVLESAITHDQFDAMTRFDDGVLRRFMVPPLRPASYGRVIARHAHVSLGAVNVSDYKEYPKTDKATVDSFIARCKGGLGVSLETTHGLIRKQSESPFIFVSGITDRVGYFAEEVDPRAYVQNTVAAHNAGVAVAWMLPMVDSLFR